jgi:malonate transporter and related proteins
MEFARRGRGVSLDALRGVARDIATNPIVFSLVLGLAGRMAGLELPALPERLLALLGQAAVPAALFALGMILSTFRLGGESRTLGIVMTLKLLALPALTYVLAAHVFALPPMFVAVTVLHAAMPVGANVFLFVTRYDRSTAAVSASILASTLTAVVTISVLLALLGAGGR